MITILGLSAALDVTYLVDRIGVGAINRPRWVSALPGGKALNAARAAHMLGSETRLIAPTGGFTGARVRASLAELGIPAPKIDLPTETRMCVTIFDDGDEAATTEFYELPAPVEGATWEEVREGILRVDSGWLAVCGSVPDDCIDDLVDALVAATSRRTVRIALDTHGPALAHLLPRIRPDVVKVNRAEAETLVDTAPGPVLARRLARLSGNVAIVTDGARGAYATSDDEDWHVPAPPAGRYAVGSGDCFLAGLLTGLDEAEPAPVLLPEALRLATATAAANTLIPGAALFNQPDVEAMLSRVMVHSRS